MPAMVILLSRPAQVFAQAVERFPRPDFQSGYMWPILQTPYPRAVWLEYTDIAVLAAALSLASWLALKRRSRRGLFLLMVFNLAYFGFFRRGCICPVGSVQNVACALFYGGYVIPVAAIAFFALPLVFTLFFGRTFCAAVCPLGAIQDAVILRPVRVAPVVAHVLGFLPYVYLGLAVLFAATGAGFIICRYDPFVGFFRFGASFTMIVLGVFMLTLGTVVARPYCRFLCPYGVLLGWMSRLSKWHVAISPDECIECRLCMESCPFGAIEPPAHDVPTDRRNALRQAVLLFFLVPVIAAGSGWAVSRLNVPLSRQHFTVSLAEEIQRLNRGDGETPSEAADAFRASGTAESELFAEAGLIRRSFRTGGWILGVFLGIALCLKLINLSIPRRRDGYSANTGSCLSCGRCFSYCPVGRVPPEEPNRPGRGIQPPS